jgi:hypothetical protein
VRVSGDIAAKRGNRRDSKSTIFRTGKNPKRSLFFKLTEACIDLPSTAATPISRRISKDTSAASQ